MAGLAERLGVAADMKAKTKIFANSHAVLEAVAKGEAEIGFGLTSDTAHLSGVDLIGALPAEIQNFTVYAAGIPASSKQSDAAKALIVFLTVPRHPSGPEGKRLRTAIALGCCRAGEESA